MLQVKNLSIYLMKDMKKIIDNLSFNLNYEDKLAIIGEEGNGKSLLIKTIFDKNLINKYAEISGEIIKNNEIIGYLPQTIEKKNLILSTKEYLEEKIESSLFDYNLYYSLLSKFNFDEEKISNNMLIGDLSGGEKIKFVLLVEMLKKPTLLLMDEPSNDLDLESIKWITSFMLGLDIPLIFVSHDIELLTNVSNRILHLEQLKRKKEAKSTIVNFGYEEYKYNRDRDIKNQIIKSNKEHEEFSKKLKRFQRVHDSVECALRSTKNDVEGKNLKDKMRSIKSLEKILEKERKELIKKPDIEDPVLINFDSNIDIPNGKIILDFKLNELKVPGKILSKNIELKIKGPEKICIVGKNGVGKTTLIRAIYKELLSLNMKVGYMPQNYFDLEDYDISAIEYLSSEYTKDEHTKISLYLGSLNFTREEMFHKIYNLSGGQKAKLFFAKMNIDRAEVIILDEPTRNISPTSHEEVIKALIEYKGVIISVSHDQRFIKNVCDKVYELTENGLIFRSYN